MRRRSGFTLIELAAVMVLVAILAATVGISLRGRVTKLRLETIANRLENLDRQTRDLARRQRQPMRLRIDTTSGTVEQGFASQTAPLKRVRVGEQVDIDQLWLPRGRRSGSGDILISAAGQSSTYALRLSSESGQRAWLLVCGLSGQVVRVESDEAIQSLLAYR